MDLKAHLQEFGALAQFLAPEKSEVFRRTNFEYLIQLNKRKPEETQTIFWEGICTNLTRRLTGLQHSDSRQSKSEVLQTAINLSIFLPKINASSAMDQITPIQTVVTEFPFDETAGVSLSTSALSHELTAQAFNDFQEALYVPKDQSKWLLISTFKQFHAAVKLDPQNYFAQFNYGYLHGFFFRKPEKAAQHFEAAVANAFDKDIVFTVFALRHLAETRREMKQFDAAIEAANEALMLDRYQTLQIRYDLARYLSLAGQHEKAFGYLEELLSEHSEFYWQAISEPDFTENRDIVTLLNALSQVYLELDDTISPSSEFSIDENGLAKILDENDRINTQHHLAVDIKTLLKEAHKLIRSSRPTATDTNDVEPPTEVKKPIIARQDKDATTTEFAPNGHTGQKSPTADDILNLAKATADKNPPPELDENDILFDEFSPEIEQMLDRIREEYFQHKEEALKEKSRPLTEAEIQQIREERQELTDEKQPGEPNAPTDTPADNTATGVTDTAKAQPAPATEGEDASTNEAPTINENIEQRLQTTSFEANVAEPLPDTNIEPAPEISEDTVKPIPGTGETSNEAIPNIAATPELTSPPASLSTSESTAQPETESDLSTELYVPQNAEVAGTKTSVASVDSVKQEKNSAPFEKYIEQIEAEVANAISRCHDLDSIFTRSDMLETIQQIRSIGKEFIQNLPEFSPVQGKQKTRQVINMIREAVFLFQHRHPLVAKLRGIKLDDYR
jgi:tetratricopeptide (TPR) repeat protein